MERRLAQALGLSVAIAHAGEGGEVRLRYRTLEQLDDIIARLERAPAAGE